MAGVSSWYDPVCYQFFFYAIDDKEISKLLLKAYREFAEEMTPCYMQWLAKGGRVIGNLGSQWQSRIQIINSEDDFAYHQFSLSSHDGANCSLSLVPGKALSCFAMPAKSIQKEWRDRVSRYTDPKQMGQIDKAEQKKWLYPLMTCPSDDLRGIYFPKRSFTPNEIPLKLSLASDPTQSRLAYMNEIIQDLAPSVSHTNEEKTQYFHRLYVSIPRYFFDSIDQAFSLQNAWKKRMTTLCEEFENSVGYMKMDACELCHSSPILTGSGNFLPGFSKYLPDISWAMCLTKHQIETLGGMEYLRGLKIFHLVETLRNGHSYLQLTPDISLTTRAEATGLWALISPHLRMSSYNLNCIAEIPVSFRLGLESSQLKIEDYGQYRINR